MKKENPKVLKNKYQSKRYDLSSFDRTQLHNQQDPRYRELLKKNQMCDNLTPLLIGIIRFLRF